jgi:hypothetical protein
MDSGIAVSPVTLYTPRLQTIADSARDLDQRLRIACVRAYVISANGRNEYWNWAWVPTSAVLLIGLELWCWQVDDDMRPICYSKIQRGRT